MLSIGFQISGIRFQLNHCQATLPSSNSMSGTTHVVNIQQEEYVGDNGRLNCVGFPLSSSLSQGFSSVDTTAAQGLCPPRGPEPETRY